jgi:hypothetical protein
LHKIDEVKERRKMCKQHQMIFYLQTNVDPFKYAQIIRDYGWLCFYEMKLHACILKQYFLHKDLDAALNLYQDELIKQQEGG